MSKERERDDGAGERERQTETERSKRYLISTIGKSKHNVTPCLQCFNKAPLAQVIT